MKHRCSTSWKAVRGRASSRGSSASRTGTTCTVDLLGQLEHSYKTRLGYWKGGTVSVFGYGGGIIPRFSEVASMFPESKEFHTVRVQPPAGNHYTTKVLRQLSDSWNKWGSGLIAFHGQTGNIMFIGTTSENTQHFFDEINEYGFDLGGAGPCVRTAMSCVGAARCEQSCTNEHRIHRTLVNNFIDDMHRPALPYKFKFKVSGCPNDCMNSIQRADFAVIGTWRDDMAPRGSVEEVVAEHGKYALDNVIARCPTKALSLNDTTASSRQQELRAVHALHQCHDQGAQARQGSRHHAPHRRQAHAQDRRHHGHGDRAVHEDGHRRGLRQAARARRHGDRFLGGERLEHERCGEMIERIGLANFLEGIGVEVDPNMITHPRTSSYVRLDDWDQEAQRSERKNPAVAESRLRRSQWHTDHR